MREEKERGVFLRQSEQNNTIRYLFNLPPSCDVVLENGNCFSMTTESPGLPHIRYLLKKLKLRI